MTEKKSGIRISRLTIKNYKKLDSLEIYFPRPVMKGDADILLFGSKNGGGKTSVLECCALVTLAGMVLQASPATGEFWSRWNAQGDLNTSKLLIKAGQQEAIIVAEFEQNEKKCSVSLEINCGGYFKGSRSLRGGLIRGDDVLFFGSRLIQSPVC